MKEVAVKKHLRRSRRGKVVPVSTYFRRVGKKGVHSPKKMKPKKSKKGIVEPGDEFADKKAILEDSIKQTPPQVEQTIPEPPPIEPKTIKRETRKKSSKSKDKDEKPTVKRTQKKGYLEKVEDKIAGFVEKYSKKKYKRML